MSHSSRPVAFDAAGPQPGERLRGVARVATIDGHFIVNAFANYDFGNGLTAAVNVNNLLDKDPPLVPRQTEVGLTYPTLQGLYDVIGRFYTAGVRFKF